MGIDSSQVIGEKHSFTHFETVPKDYLEVVKKGQKAKIAGLVPLNQVGYFKQEVNEEERTVTTKWVPYILESK